MTKYIEAAREATIIAEKHGIPIAESDFYLLLQGHWQSGCCAQGMRAAYLTG